MNIHKEDKEIVAWTVAILVVGIAVEYLRRLT